VGGKEAEGELSGVSRSAPETLYNALSSRILRTRNETTSLCQASCSSQGKDVSEAPSVQVRPWYVPYNTQKGHLEDQEKPSRDYVGHGPKKQDNLSGACVTVTGHP
jgi:hypothetical protein